MERALSAPQLRTKVFNLHFPSVLQCHPCAFFAQAPPTGCDAEVTLFAQPTEGTDRKESQTMTIASTRLADQTVGQVLDTIDEITANPHQYLHDEEAQRYIAAAVEDVNVRDAYVPTGFNDSLCSLFINAHTYAATPYAAANCLCLAAIACLEDTKRRDFVEEASYRCHDHTLARLLLRPDYT